jgi:hypothetical protein
VSAIGAVSTGIRSSAFVHRRWDHLVLAQFCRRWFVGIQRNLFFGVRFTGAAIFQPARNYIGLDSLGKTAHAICSITWIDIDPMSKNWKNGEALEKITSFWLKPVSRSPKMVSPSYSSGSKNVQELPGNGSVHPFSVIRLPFGI